MGNEVVGTNWIFIIFGLADWFLERHFLRSTTISTHWLPLAVRWEGNLPPELPAKKNTNTVDICWPCTALLKFATFGSQCVAVCSSIASQKASWISSYKFLHPVNLNDPVSNIPRTKQHISSFHFTEIAANFRNCSTSATSELSGHLEQRSAASENMPAVNPNPVLRLQIA